MKPDVSIVLVAWRMDRELPRTLETLSRRMQRGVDSIEYEVIVVDNGSPTPVRPAHDRDVKVIRIDGAGPSPAAAINAGVAVASADLIGVCVDGARMASPGLVRYALLAARLGERAVISTLGFHLGPDVQMKTVLEGYDQSREDDLLATAEWESDGYNLFRISSFAGSSGKGWFMPIAESNALFMTRQMWQELGGYDERFASPGGGLVNLDTYRRACDLPDSDLYVLLGEGTFHQMHGGVATNARSSRWDEFHREYIDIRGTAFAWPKREPVYLGGMPEQALPGIRASIDIALSAL